MRQWLLLIAFVVTVGLVWGSIAWYVERPRPSSATTVVPDPNYDGPCCVA